MAENPNQISVSVKLVTGVLSLLIMFAGVLYAVEDRYVTQEEAATSLQTFDNAVKKDLINLELQILNTSLENATDQYYKHKQLIREHPADNELKEETTRLKARMKSIQDKIDSKLKIH